MGGRDPGRVQRFDGKVALVTGGSKGIGREIALRLADEGAAVAITWFRDRDGGLRTLGELEERTRAYATRAMLKSSESPERIVEEVRAELGEPQLLVSNAASGAMGLLEESTDTQWQWALETNATALLRFVRAAPSLEAIVAMSGYGASRVLVKYGTIGVSKAALEALVRYLAVELAPRCHVNAISTTALDTESLRSFERAEEILERTLRGTPAGRLVTAAEIAGLAAYLLSDEAAMVTGQVIQIDGGFSTLGYAGMRVDEW